MSDKILSVIIPIYNSSEYIRETINSIVCYINDSIEVICVDDGSTDDTLNILAEYSGYRNIKLLQQKHLGASKARNYGISEAKGKYILFFDSDDILNGEVIHHILPILKKEEIDLFIFNYKLINEKGIKVGKRKHKNYIFDFFKKERLLYLYLIPPFPGNKIYKSSILKDHSITFASVKIGQDLNFYLKFLPYAKKIRFFNYYISSYRLRSMSISHSYDERILDIINSLKNIFDFYEENNLNYYIHFLYFSEIGALSFQCSKLKEYSNEKVKRAIFNEFDSLIEEKFINIKKENFYEKIKFFQLYKNFKKTKEEII